MASTGLDNDIAVPVQTADVTDQISNDFFDWTAPENNGGTTAAAPLLASSAPAPDAAAGSTGEHTTAQANLGYADEAQSQADYQLFYNSPTTASFIGNGAFAAPTAVSLNPITSATQPAHVANSEGQAEATSGAITEAVGPQGATAQQVQQALDESGLSVNGSGIKVGVISDSFNDLGGAAADEADGALPTASNIDVIKDLPSGGTDEGRAMMQVIHDIAPGASLAFYTADESEQDFANGILALAAAGCKVICDDVAYYDEPFFQNGVVAQAIQTVEAEGVTYVTAAGNEASNGYQAAWTPISGSFDGINLTDAESFGGSLVQTVTINAEGTGYTVPLVLQWNQPYGAATSNLEMVVFRSNGTLLGEFTNQNAGQELHNPLVIWGLGTGTYYVAIENLSGPNPGLIKEITEGDGLPATISGANTGTVVGHAETPGAITAGAVSAADTPAFGFSPTSESFSSSGAGAELLFANNGTALSSPDLLDPVVVSSVDDIATTISGNLGDFYGTSAASASLAGVAALILAANPSLTAAEVEQIMQETALPMSNSAVSGAGLVQVDPAVAAAFALETTVIESFGSTSLVQVGHNYYLDSVGSGTGPELQYGGAPVAAGEFVGATLIGAEATATGYEVA
ncbi:S8 family peptidase, partial [Bradyrhizobium sp.]|uniref:S8 family peptidase n=1 Tax=Bradyrhizobium sp. TaxID=376 RepID=UPI003C14D808